MVGSKWRIALLSSLLAVLVLLWLADLSLLPVSVWEALCGGGSGPPRSASSNRIVYPPVAGPFGAPSSIAGYLALAAVYVVCRGRALCTWADRGALKTDLVVEEPRVEAWMLILVAGIVLGLDVAGQFRSIFASMNVELPLSTRGLLAVAHACSIAGCVFPLGLAAAGLWSVRYLFARARADGGPFLLAAVFSRPALKALTAALALFVYLSLFMPMVSLVNCVQ